MHALNPKCTVISKSIQKYMWCNNLGYYTNKLTDPTIVRQSTLFAGI
jgi:hypothetical protein